MSGLIKSFRKGRDTAYAERGRGRPASNRAADSNRTEETRGRATNDEAARLLAEVTELAEQLQKRVGEIEAERDDTKKLLAEIVAEAEPRQKRVEELERDLAEEAKLIGEMATQVEALQQRVGKVEAERDAFAEVLQFPGVRKVLLKVVHPDAHPNADEYQRRELAEWSGKVNAVYELFARNMKASP